MAERGPLLTPRQLRRFRERPWRGDEEWRGTYRNLLRRCARSSDAALRVHAARQLEYWGWGR